MDDYKSILDSWMLMELIGEGDLFENGFLIKEPEKLDDPRHFFTDKLKNLIEDTDEKQRKYIHLDLYFGTFYLDDIIEILRKTYGLNKTDEDVEYGKRKFSVMLSFDSELNYNSKSFFLTQCSYIKDNKKYSNSIKHFDNKCKELNNSFSSSFEKSFNSAFNELVEKYGDVYYCVSYKQRAMLHSFYYDDLNQADKLQTDNLKRYLSAEINENDRIELDDETKLGNIISLLAPESFPSGRFISSTEYGLSLMQQVAVNVAVNEHGLSMRSVNGPPGTGKTTLLKDIFAEYAVQQAHSICKLRNRQLEKNLVVCGERKIGVLPSDIADKGIVVASSNNGAVRNIVNDLPLIERNKDTGEIQDADGFYRELKKVDYFSKTARMKQDDLIRSENKNKDGAEIARIIKNTPECFWGMYSAEGGSFANQKALEGYLKSISDSLQGETENKSVYDEFEAMYNDVAECKKRIADLIKLRKKIEEYENEQRRLDERIKQNKEKLDDKNFKNGFLNHNAKKTKKAIKTDEIEFERLISLIRNADEKLNENLDSLGDIAGSKMNLSESMAHDEIQQTVLYYGKQFRKKQTMLFIKALDVRKQFLIANKDSFKIAIEHIWNFRKDESKTQQQLKAAWDWVNFAIPVIGTTFASMGNMFRFMKQENIANLFIDEAGQATPHHAVGAIMRSRKIMAVGDPDQIEPVLVLDSNIQAAIRNSFDVSETFISPKASVQTLFDRCGKYGYYKDNNGDKVWIGMPLWVHRRCKDPMFSIANEISYGGKMVLGKGNSDTMGKAQWIDVGGKANDKYVVEQGERLKDEIDKRSEEEKQGIYVISPFRNVKDKLQGVLKGIVPDSNIGTVHTFQGKETNIVYLVLGADENSKGAAHWAVEKPNIINVAATRAREEFYIIGDKKLYKSLKAETIERTLKVIERFSETE